MKSGMKPNHFTPMKRKRSSSCETEDDLLDYYDKLLSPFDRTLALLKEHIHKEGDPISCRTLLQFLKSEDTVTYQRPSISQVELLHRASKQMRDSQFMNLNLQMGLQ